MKKIIIAAVAVAFAAAVQAASFNWSCTGSRTTGTIYDYTGTAIGTGVVAYLFDTATISQADLLAAVRGGSSLESLTSMDHSTTASSKIAKTTDFEYGQVGSTYSAYFAILDTANEQVLISSVAMAPGLQGDTATFEFGASAATFSKNVMGEASYTSAGWYSTVPEPTSALLLLLGVAGLALKRKQA